MKKTKLLLATGLLTMAGAANAGYTFDLTPDDKITFGGYIKADLRYTDGDLAAREYFIGTAGGKLAEDISNIRGHVNETRINAKYQHGDVTGFVEMDFFGTATTGGANANEQFSNSSNPRLRHAFIKYKNVLVGQTWSTFQNTSALAEAADFGGPLVSAAFIRQYQIRYTNGGLQLSLENPETRGGTSGDDSRPDVIAKYTFKGDWGNVSVSGLLRELNNAGEDETAVGYGIAGRIKTGGKDDFRFQLHGGETGRYVGVAAANDIFGGEVEETTAISVAYRHFWNDDTRSTVFYGNTTTDESDIDNTHWGVNIFKNYTKQLSFGLEVGQFDQEAAGGVDNGESTYVQLSAKYVL